MRPDITRCSYIQSVFFFTSILSVAPVTLLTQMPTRQLIHRTQLHCLPELPTAASVSYYLHLAALDNGTVQPRELLSTPGSTR